MIPFAAYAAGGVLEWTITLRDLERETGKRNALCPRASGMYARIPCELSRRVFRNIFGSNSVVPSVLDARHSVSQTVDRRHR